MTPNREDYIKAIHQYNVRFQKVTNKMLSETLGISAPSVSEMINKLMMADVIIKDKTLGYTLSSQGMHEAQRLINKHRLWEVFLVDHLGYQWDEVHDDAEVLEHATSDLLLERLNAFLEYPKVCPHGSIIYGNGQDAGAHVILSKVKVGQKISIKSIDEIEGLASYLLNKKMSIDRVYSIVSINAFDQSMELVNEEGVGISISEKALEHIKVEVLG